MDNLSPQKTPDLIWSFLCKAQKLPRFLDNSSSQRMVKKKGTFKMSSTNFRINCHVKPTSCAANKFPTTKP